MPERPGGPLIAALLRVPYQAVIGHVARGVQGDFPDIRPAHLIIFQIIERPPSGSRLTQLAAEAQMTAQSMGELIDSLERTGYVERVPDLTDRRAKLIRLTDRGMDVYTRGGDLVLEVMAAWSARMGSDKFERLLGSLRELSASLATDPRPISAADAASGLEA